MRRDTYVTTMFDAGVGLRDVPIAARHAYPPRDHAPERDRKDLDRHPNYIPAAHVAAGTR